MKAFAFGGQRIERRHEYRCVLAPTPLRHKARALRTRRYDRTLNHLEHLAHDEVTALVAVTAARHMGAGAQVLPAHRTLGQAKGKPDAGLAVHAALDVQDEIRVLLRPQHIHLGTHRHPRAVAMQPRTKERAPRQRPAQVMPLHQRTTRRQPIHPRKLLLGKAAVMLVHLVVAQVQREYRHLVHHKWTQRIMIDRRQRIRFRVRAPRTHQRT